MSKPNSQNIDIKTLNSEVQNYFDTLQKIRKKYLFKEEPPTNINMRTDIKYLKFSDIEKDNTRIYNALYRYGIHTVEELLNSYHTRNIEKIKNLGPKSISILIPFIESNLLSLKPESITDLYYEMFQNATSIETDLETLEEIYDSFEQYIRDLEPDSEQDLSKKLQYLSLLRRFNDLMPLWRLTSSNIRENFSLLKKSYRTVFERATNGEFIEFREIGRTLMNTSEQDSSTALKKQFEDYRTTINTIRAKYSPSISLNKDIANLQFSNSKRRNNSIIYGLLRGYIHRNDDDLDEDYYKYGYRRHYPIRTVYDLLLFYISSNDLSIASYGTKLNEDSINIIEQFIQDNLLHQVFTKDIINAYSSKNSLIKDTKTINDLLQTLREFQQTVETESKSEQSYYRQESFNESPSYYLADRELRNRLNRKALYKSHAIGLINDCTDIIKTLEQIQKCLATAVQLGSNAEFIKYLTENNILGPGGEEH